MDDKELEARRQCAREIMKDVMKVAEKCVNVMGEPWLLSELRTEHPEWFDEGR